MDHSGVIGRKNDLSLKLSSHGDCAHLPVQVVINHQSLLERHSIKWERQGIRRMPLILDLPDRLESHLDQEYLTNCPWLPELPLN